MMRMGRGGTFVGINNGNAQADPPRCIISLLVHGRAHNFRINLSGAGVGDHGKRTPVHNGRNW